MSRRIALPALQRITTSGAYLPAIDGLRFIAISWVVLYHIHGYLVEKWQLAPATTLVSRAMDQFLGAGHYGVQLFFAISGYILARPFAAHALAGGKRVSLRAYFRRRLTRLEPPYLISLFAFAALYVGFVGAPISEVVPHFLASAAYLHNAIYGRMSTINSVAWSLEVEVQFYAIVPLLALAFRIGSPIGRRSVFVALAAASAVAQTMVVGSERFELSILNALQYFLVGVLLADIDVSGARPLGTFIDWMAILGWPITLAFTAWASPATTRWLLPICVFCLYYAALRGSTSKRFLSLRPVAIIGGMCYSIYLLHQPLISFAGRAIPPGAIRRSGPAPTIALLYFLFVILGASIVFFVLVERPCMRPDWPKRVRTALRERAESSTMLGESTL